MSEKPPDSWRPTIRRRVVVAAGVLAAWSLVIVGRLVDLQVLRHDDLIGKAKKQSTVTLPIPVKRGTIVDRNGELLAHSADLPSIYANLKKADGCAEDAADALCDALGECTPGSRQKLRTKLSARQGHPLLKRYASLDAARRVSDLKLEWIEIDWEAQRVYPHREVVAPVLGKAGTDQDGLAGIESSKNSLLSGTAGKRLLHVDAKGEVFDTRIESPPVPGTDIELTIDLPIQEIAERELRAGVLRNRARSGIAVVLDSPSGAVLAMAQYPTFNPNAPTSLEVLRNAAVADAMELGSVMKIVTASAALEEHVVTPEDVIDTSGGKIFLGRNRSDFVSDSDHDYGKLLFADVIAKSSNVGTIKVALKLGAARLIDALTRFGFGRRISGEFPGEQSGVVKDASSLANEEELARVAIGYNVTVTPLQLAVAMNSIANGGELVQPGIVQASHENGVRRVFPRHVLNRTMPHEVAPEMTSILERVVTSGTGRDAQVPGYSVAGKTGTAGKWIAPSYSKTDYFATFVGFVPSRSPAFTIVVVLDSPKGPSGHFGGPAAGPIFARIAEGALRVAGVPRTVNPPQPLLVRRDPEGVRERPTSGPASPPAALVAIDHQTGADGRLPDVTGMSVREALVTLSRLGVIVRPIGSGLVIDQRPLPGTPFEAGTPATLWFGFRPPAPQTANRGRP